MAIKITDPKWSTPHSIDVMMDHPRFGKNPYTAIDNSGEDQMQTIWDGLMRGDFGPIAPLEAE